MKHAQTAVAAALTLLSIASYPASAQICSGTCSCADNGGAAKPGGTAFGALGAGALSEYECIWVIGAAGARTKLFNFMQACARPVILAFLTFFFEFDFHFWTRRLQFVDPGLTYTNIYGAPRSNLVARSSAAAPLPALKARRPRRRQRH